MKAIRIHQYGSIDNAVLEEIPVPKIGLDEVLVQVEAASINPLDVKFWHGSKAGNTLRTAAGEKATTSQGDLR